MSLFGHIEALRREQVKLNRLIERESKRPLPNPTALHELKSRRLKVKDELGQFI